VRRNQLQTGLDVVQQWFADRGRVPFEYQLETWRAYLQGHSGLVHAPTGMGKTYAVWLGPIIEWIDEEEKARRHEGTEARRHEGTQARSQTATERRSDGATKRRRSSAARDSAPALRVLWLTPLRALATDTVEQLHAAAEELGLPWTIDKRTGDTPASVRARHRKQLPTALVTTPESLSIMLSYPGAAAQLASLRCVIVDEWHELMGTKRGVQAELGLARLRSMHRAMPLRTWGLSATLGNLEQAMHTLLGHGAHARRARLINAELPKRIEIDTLRPDDVERFPWSGHLGTKLLPQVIEAIERASSTLLFTNVRSQAETWFQTILRARPDWIGSIALHHGSIDRDIRFRIEQMLRRGTIKCVVCTSSLDLGVDFSPVDQVIQLGSPKGIARLLQRAGRSGHQPGSLSRVLGVPTNALELIEYAAAREAAAARRVEAREPLIAPLDVLAQHLVTLACGDGFDEAQVLDEVRSTHAYAGITSEEWRWTMDFITRGGDALRAYPQYQRVTPAPPFRIASDRLARMHRMSIGTITADASIRVTLVRGGTLGHIEESFISRLKPGDRFVFAGRVLELVRVRDMTAHVRKAHGSGIIPRWMGGRSPLSHQLADAVRSKLDEARQGNFRGEEMQLVQPLLELQQRWSIIPAPDELLIERTATRAGHHVFIFTLEGRLVHEGLSALVAHRIAAASRSTIHLTPNDYGFELLTRDPNELAPDEWKQVFTTESLVDDLHACLNSSQLARRAFRDIARIAGLVFPGYPGQGKTARQLQASSGLFFDVFTQFDPENLLLRQARREVLDRELEVARMRRALERIAAGPITIIDTPHLTPLAFPIWAESLRSQQISFEKWSDRVQRMMISLEQAAERESGAAARGSNRRGTSRRGVAASRH
jgi:ATP-dependent Lhr-like helicase